MKKIGIYIGLIAVMAISVAANVKTGCEVKSLKGELLKELRPDFKYDSSHINKFKLIAGEQNKEVTVPLFSGEQYKMLFNTAALPAGYEIQIYDKPQSSRKGKLLFSVKDGEKDGHVFSYEPKKPQTMYINYILPGSEKDGIYGCAVFLMGYKIN